MFGRVETIPVPSDSSVAHVTLLRVAYSEADPETYLLPLTFAAGQQAAQVREAYPRAVVCGLHVKTKAPGEAESEGVLYDALMDKAFGKTLLEAISRPLELSGQQVVAMGSIGIAAADTASSAGELLRNERKGSA